MSGDAGQRAGLIVRVVVRDDIETLVRICGEHARYEGANYDPAGKPAALERALFGSPARLRVWVAETHGHIVGYAAVSDEFSTWLGCEFLHLDCLFVRDGHRGGGVGAALLAAVVRHARGHGYRQIQWQTPGWNIRAAGFYGREGATGAAKIRFTLEP